MNQSTYTIGRFKLVILISLCGLLVQAREVRVGNSIEAARDEVRALRGSGALGASERIDVVFAPGDYRLERFLHLNDPRDSGASEDAPIVWRAEKPGTVRIVGGVRVPTAAFTPISDDAIRSRLPSQVVVADVSPWFSGKIEGLKQGFLGPPNGTLLYVNGRHLTLARWPNEGFVSFTNAVDHGAVKTSGKGGAFIFSHPRARRWHFDEGVWCAGYWTHDWSFYAVRAATYGSENGTNDVLRLSCGVPYGVMNETWGRKDRRFYVFNLLDEIDAPGEWYLDRERKLLYLYPPNGALKPTDEVFLGTLPDNCSMVRGEKLQNVRFQDLEFGYSLGNGMHLVGTNIVVRNCKVTCVGKTGLIVDGSRNHVLDCEISQCGTTGIDISGGNRKLLIPAESSVERCHIHDFAIYKRTYSPGILLNGCGSVIRGNHIHDAPHCACLYGGNEHLFEFNDVHHVLLETGDAGAYYTGRDWTTQGNVLRYNYTHELGSGGSHANTMGFYFDDCDCGDEVYGNVFWKVSRGIMIGGGRDHPIRNNIFAECEIGMSIDTRGMTWPNWNKPGGSWHLEGHALRIGYTNALWAARYPRLANIMNDFPREPLYNPVEHNIFYNCRKQLVALGDHTITNALKRNSFVGNLVINSCGTNGVEHAIPDKRIAYAFTTLNGTKAAPCDFGFVDPDYGDFRLKPDARILLEMPGFRVLPFANCKRDDK